MNPPTSLPVRQLAYFVNDIRAAALTHHRCFGSGPYFVSAHVPLVRSVHRGTSRPFDHSSAYGQWGALMVEFVEQHNTDPSALRDAFAGGPCGGLHHIALFVPNLHAAIAAFEADRLPLAQISETASGIEFAFIDARPRWGHMLELYEPSPIISEFYTMVAAAAEDWDGIDPIRELN